MGRTFHRLFSTVFAAFELAAIKSLPKFTRTLSVKAGYSPLRKTIHLLSRMGRNTIVHGEEVSRKQDGDLDLAPRCSTPVFDPCVGSRRGTGRIFSVPDREEEKALANCKRNDQELYREWKLRLQRGKSRMFKVRGVRNRGATRNDCSIISGHFESGVVPCQGDEAAAAAAGAPPVYQMWFPFAYPRFWTPAHNCQQQPWLYGAQLHSPQYHQTHPPQFFTPAQCFFFANLCHQSYQTAQFMHCNANYLHTNPYPQMQHQAQLRHNHQLFNIPSPQFPSPASYPPPHFFHHGTNAVAFPVTMAS